MSTYGAVIVGVALVGVCLATLWQIQRAPFQLTILMLVATANSVTEFCIQRNAHADRDLLAVMNEEQESLPVDVKVLAAVSGGLGALGAHPRILFPPRLLRTCVKDFCEATVEGANFFWPQ
jgi:hypothetical protein